MSYSPKRADSSASKSASENKATRSQSAVNDDVTKKKRILVGAIVGVLVLIIVVSMLFILSPSDGSFLGIRGAGVISGGNRNQGGSQNGSGIVPNGTTNITPYYKNGVLPTSSDRHDITVIENGGANASDLYGTWKLDKGTTYMFDGQGRGIMLTGVDNYTFIYSAENGKLCIDMDTSTGNDFEYDYSVSGDTLTMNRGGNSFTLIRTDR